MNGIQTRRLGLNHSGGCQKARFCDFPYGGFLAVKWQLRASRSIHRFRERNKVGHRTALFRSAGFINTSACRKINYIRRCIVLVHPVKRSLQKLR